MKMWILAWLALAFCVPTVEAGCRVRARRAVIVQRPAVVVNARRNVVLVDRTATLVVPHARTQVILSDYVGVSAFLIGGYGSVISTGQPQYSAPPPAPTATATATAPAVDLTPVLAAVKDVKSDVASLAKDNADIKSRLSKLEAVPEDLPPAPKPVPPPVKPTPPMPKAE